MTNEKMIERIYEISSKLSAEDKATFDRYVNNENLTSVALKVLDTLPLLLAKLLIDCKNDLKCDVAKQNGSLSRLKAAEKVIKRAKLDRRELLHGAWEDPEGRQCFCDGFVAFRLYDHLPLDVLNSKLDPFDLNRVVVKNVGAKLALPDVATLKAFIKTEKARLRAEKKGNRVIYRFGDNLPSVDAEFLLEALEILPGCEAFASQEKPQLRAIYFKSNYGDGVVLPISLKEGS